MLSLSVVRGAAAWPEIAELRAQGKLIDLMDEGPAIGLALLPNSMKSGAASVTIRIDLPDGQVVLAQTSYALFKTAAGALDGMLKYADELAGEYPGS